MANSTYVLCFSSIGSPQCVVWCFPIIFVASVLNRSIQNSILSVDLLDRKITLKKQTTAKQKTPANEKTVLGAAKKNPQFACDNGLHSILIQVNCMIRILTLTGICKVHAKEMPIFKATI